MKILLARFLKDIGLDLIRLLDDPHDTLSKDASSTFEETQAFKNDYGEDYDPYRELFFESDFNAGKHHLGFDGSSNFYFMFSVDDTIEANGSRRNMIQIAAKEWFIYNDHDDNAQFTYPLDVHFLLEFIEEINLNDTAELATAYVRPVTIRIQQHQNVISFGQPQDSDNGFSVKRITDQRMDDLKSLLRQAFISIKQKDAQIWPSLPSTLSISECHRKDNDALPVLRPKFWNLNLN